MAEYHTPKILSDNPLQHGDTADFHFDQFAITLARLIADKNTQTPLTIGISGSWGSGKTTLLRRLQRQLEATRPLRPDSQQPANLEFINADEETSDYRPCQTVWFNAWKYANEDSLLAALLRTVVQAMFRADVVSKLGAAFWEPFTPRRDVVETVLGWFSIKTPFVEMKPNLGKAQPTQLAQKSALLDEFDEVFDRLLAVWLHGSPAQTQVDDKQAALVVFIDDLDRCLPAKTIQVLEAIKLFFDKPGCVFVLGADIEVIQQAVLAHYKDLSSPAEATQKAEDYLEKLVQIRFRLPQIGEKQLQDYLQRQPQVVDEMQQRWQALVAAAEANPRRVKAVVNDLELQWRMLQNAGQAANVNRDDFICWQALLRAAPPAFREEFFGIPADPGGLRLRHQFILDALEWVCGSAERRNELEAAFQKYRGRESRRLREVLRQVRAFSPEFSPASLDAHVHLLAPPAPGATVEAAAGPTPDPETLEPVAAGKNSARGPEARSDRLIIAGLEFCRIPAGDFVMGSADDDKLASDNERPRHTLSLPYDYWLGRYPVTNRQFSVFCQAIGYQTTAEKEGSAYVYNPKTRQWQNTHGANWRQPGVPDSSLAGKDEHPVVCVSWHDALAYCDWLNQAFAAELPPGLRFTLPSEAEWEKASRDPRAGRAWPWGSQPPDANLCNFDMNVGDTTPAGRYSPQGDSPYGCADMAGNVWEWTRSLHKLYPYNPADGREQLKSSDERVLRGGSFAHGSGQARCSARHWDHPDYRNGRRGFRVVCAAHAPQA